MAYNNNIPLPTSLIRVSQKEIRENFREIQNLFTVNHLNFSPAVFAGAHSRLTLPEQAAPPVTGANECALFSQVGAVTGNTELAWRRESNGATINFTEFLGAANGYTRMPSGILIKWQRVTIPGSFAIETNFIFPWDAGLPGFSSFIIGFISPITTAGGSLGANSHLDISTSTANIVITSRTNQLLSGWPPYNIFVIGIGT